MNLEEMQELGLSEGQVDVYEAILEQGNAGIQSIQEKTGLDRRAIYDTINKLIEKGFITYVEEKGVRKYQCTSPKNIKEKVEEKQKILESLYNKIPSINDVFNSSKAKINATVYRGNEGIKSLFNEILDYDTSFWMGGNSFEEYMAVPEHLQVWFKHWMQKRADQKKYMYDLVAHGTHLKGLEPNNKKAHKKMYYKYCSLPEGLYTPLVIIVFGNKVAQIVWGKQSFAFVLESEKVKESFMKYFNHFWKEH